jgi:hypothetical protein
MRIGALSAGVIASLFLGAGQASAFEETREAPPAALQVAPDASQPAMQLQTPAPGQTPPSTEKSGTTLFGFSFLPKLDFGLELLYSEPQAMDLQQQGSPTDGGNGDLTVLGKVKRHF